jgi:acetyl esterase/lipase
MESFQSKLAKLLLRIIKLNKMWKLTGEELEKNIERKQLAESHKPPKRIENKYNIVKSDINENSYYVMKPLNNIGQKHILFLHGGGYVYDLWEIYWVFFSKLIDVLGCTITIPIYPLAPKHGHEEVFNMIVPIYEQIISEVKFNDIVIMGDSAGGGMSLALAELLKEKNLQQPGNIILISPALDMSMSNPEIQEVEKLDPILAAPALSYITKWYGGEKGSKHYLVSPIYGNFEGLGKISLFTGTNDILHPDAKKFKAIADEKGIEINYYEYPSMIHIWPLLFFPESKKATGEIIGIIKSS